MILAATLSVLVGLSLGILGGGGSILTVPILVYALGVPEASVIGMSLFIVGATSLVGTLQHARKGAVHWRSGLLFSVAGMAGSFLGGRAAAYVPVDVLLLLFALLMLVTGGAMLRKRGEADGCPTGKLARGKILLIGALVGVVTGLLGAGGGFLVVPALAVFGRLPMAQAVATSLLVITLNSFAGFAGHLTHIQMDWPLTFVMTAAAGAGALAGAKLGARLSPTVLRKAFGVFVILMGVYMVVRQGSTLGWAALLAHWPYLTGGAAILALALVFLQRFGSPAAHPRSPS